MQIVRCTPEEYRLLFPKPSHVFNTVEFNELNRHKCEDIHYLTFRDDKGKTRFGIILGQKGDVLKSPFSAPFGGMEECREQRVGHYLHAIEVLKEYAQKERKTILINLPPSIYDVSSCIAKQYCSLTTSKSKILYADYNFHYPLWKYNDFKQYLWPEIRNKFNQSQRETYELKHFDIGDNDDVETVYDIISRNHKALGYPLHMSLADIIATASIIGIHFFTVSHNSIAVAAAMVYETSETVSQVIYWGDLPEYRNIRPMNYLSHKVIEYYANLGKKFLDIGPSSSDGQPSLGLCDFKSGLGCEITPKVMIEL